MNGPTSPEPELLGSVRKELDAAQTRAKALKAEAREADRISKMWGSLESYLVKKWPLHTLALLNKDKNQASNAVSARSESATLLEIIRQQAEKEAADILRRFPSYLEKACNEANIPPDRDSRHPRYKFEQGFFQLEIVDRTKSARLYDYEGRLDQFPADIGAIVDILSRERERIFGRSFDGNAFLNKLRQQYLAVIRIEGSEDGEVMPIRRITGRLGKNEKGFRTDEFLVDLSRLVTQGPFEIDGRKIDLQQTKDARKGMLLHGPGGRGYIGFITFREVSS